MRTITAPGVEIKEIDKSGYSPAMTGTACYIMGFTDKGEAYQPMEFTSRAAFVSYYGDPDNEAERYFYAAANEVLNNNGRLYCARLPYDNDAFEKLVGYTYSVTDSKLQDLSTCIDEYTYPELTQADKTIDKVSLIEGSNNPILFDLAEVDEYRTGEALPQAGKLIIIDKTCGTYKKIPEDTRKGINREIVGIVPVVTTAANALLAQSMIQVEPQNIKYYETIGHCKTLITKNFKNEELSNAGIPDRIFVTVDDTTTKILNPDLVTQLNTDYKGFKKIDNLSTVTVDLVTIGMMKETVDEITNIETDLSSTIISSNPDLSAIVDDFNEQVNNIVDNLAATSDVLLQSYMIQAKACEIKPTDKVEQVKEKIETIYKIVNLRYTLVADDGDIAVPDTVSLQANTYFTPIEYNTDIEAFDRTNLKKIGIVVFKAFIDAGNGNKIAFTPVEAFVGSLNSKDKDPNTGATTFIDTIVNTQSEYINVFSNCWSTKAKQKIYDDLDLYIAKPISNVGDLGFYGEQTEEKIGLSKSILDGINKCFEKVSDINERNIDIVCDAGISNIAAYLKAMESVLGKAAKPYDLEVTDSEGLPLIKVWKTTANDDAMKMWKTVVQKLDTFCKNVRKDCMFITECPRPMVLQGQKKLIRPSKPANNIDVNILPYVKLITGLNTSYGAGYMDWFQVADDYSGDLFWLPPSIKAMGCYINTDVNFNYWDAPAGLTRGLIQAVDVAFSPNSKQAGAIYEKNWNFSINYPSDGIVLEGQKTFQVKPSAFDRVNVRRLFLRLERAAYQVARYFVYEGNTAYTRQRLVDALDPYFKEAKIGGGIYDYKIKCDEGNNDPTTIDRNELKVSIGIKPVKSAEFILIDFIALSTGGSFEEAGL
jgi:hypothetical protein